VTARRQLAGFARGLAGAASCLFAATLVAACAAAVVPLPGAEANEPIPFIDAHAHLNDEATQLALMRRHGAERAIVFWGRDSDNESIAESARRHSDKFIAFASISPERAAYRQLWNRDDPRVLRTLDTLLASGRFQGIGEISAVRFPSPGVPEADYDPTGPTMTGILALARRYRVAVLLHIEWTRMRELSALLEQFPMSP
jgi:Tat protein secretion system quality control protein TatD with DNase activity